MTFRKISDVMDRVSTNDYVKNQTLSFDWKCSKVLENNHQHIEPYWDHTQVERQIYVLCEIADNFR